MLLFCIFLFSLEFVSRCCSVLFGFSVLCRVGVCWLVMVVWLKWMCRLLVFCNCLRDVVRGWVGRLRVMGVVWVVRESEERLSNNVLEMMCFICSVLDGGVGRLLV